MIRGRVNAKLSPVIRLRVIGPVSNEQSEIDVIVDTGFNGGLMLPRSAIRDLELAERGFVTGILATGKTVTTKAYGAIVEWNREYRFVEVLPTEGDPLFGTKLLRGFQLIANMYEGGTVKIQKAVTHG